MASPSQALEQSLLLCFCRTNECGNCHRLCIANVLYGRERCTCRNRSLDWNVNDDLWNVGLCFRSDFMVLDWATSAENRCSRLIVDLHERTLSSCSCPEYFRNEMTRRPSVARTQRIGSDASESARLPSINKRGDLCVSPFLATLC